MKIGLFFSREIMLRRVLFLGLSLTAFESFAQVSLETFGERFDAKNIEIAWNVPRTQLPALNTLRVVPTTFSSEVVSNIIALCDFKDTENARRTFQRLAEGKDCSYEEPDPEKPVPNKSLRISPQNGCINYYNRTAQALPRIKIEGVPSESQTLDLAVSLLPKLGIKESELAHKSGKDELECLKVLQTVGSFGRRRQGLTDEAAVRGVILFRQVNGVSFSGAGDCDGLRVEFGNKSQIKELSFTWRTLQKEKIVPIPGSIELVKKIKDGESVIKLPETLASVSAIKKLIVVDIKPYYFGFDGRVWQKMVYPYLMLTANAVTENTNAVVWISCAIVK